MLAGLTPQDLQARADELSWYHTIDLRDGVVTKGMSTLLWREDQLPDPKGRTVLDIGAWDGRYSFMAERKGATRVVALDHYAWGLDFGAREAYWRECAEAGVLPDHQRDVTDFWRSDLPGRRGFEFAHEALASSVEPVVADFMTTDLSQLGEFDVVLYLGVLYHMPEPLTALERVRAVTREVAAIETVAIQVPGREEERLIEFHAGNELGGDFGNWYVPSPAALEAWCLAAGFRRVETVVGPPQVNAQPAPVEPRPFGVRLREALRPTALPVPPLPSATVHYRALIHAFT